MKGKCFCSVREWARIDSRRSEARNGHDAKGRPSVKLAVIGCGYVGLVSGSCLAEAGHEVIATDNDGTRIAALQAGKIPIYESHLDKELDSVEREGRMRFTANSVEAVREDD